MMMLLCLVDTWIRYTWEHEQAEASLGGQDTGSSLKLQQ